MRKFIIAMLSIATLLTASCNKEEGDNSDKGKDGYTCEYTITGVESGATAQNTADVLIDIMGKTATVTLKSVQFHADMQPRDIIFPNIPYSESQSSASDLIYGFYAQSVTPLDSTGAAIDSKWAEISSFTVKTDYKKAYIRFNCYVEGRENYIFEFSNYDF